ncbi:MAG: galactokinase family protein [Oscillospiraceae bacterium]
MDKIYHFSAPGRTEIGGNHTDHQHGCVIAAAVDMTTTAEVTPQRYERHPRRFRGLQARRDRP